MTNRMVGLTPRLAVAALIMLGASVAHAETKCDMRFRLEGWSAFYKTAHGAGTITCDNGQNARAVINTRGGGITFGKMKIVNGHGDFTPVDDIHELFGDYASAEAHAGAGETAAAQVVTKGTVSLTLTGKGRGVNLGFAFGKFSIEHVRTARRKTHDSHDNDHDNDNN